MTKPVPTGIPGAGRSKLADPPIVQNPEDPHEHEPMRDPPIFPEQDDDGLGEVRKANRPGGIAAQDPSPDSTS